MSEPVGEVAAQGWSKDLADCHPSIVAAYPIVEAQFLKAHPDLWMRPDYTWRSPAFQHTLFEKGRAIQGGVWVLVNASEKVTDDDGVIRASHHNVYPSQAADFIIFREKSPLWSNPHDLEDVNTKLYIEIATMFEAQGLVAGATWKFNWKDYSHVQVAYTIV